MKRPNVIDPPDFVYECDEDHGVCACPVCGEFYEMVGRVILCDCGFSFPTDWWSQYSKGCGDGRRVAEGGSESGGMRRRQDQHPYYRIGFQNPVTEAWKAKDSIDWAAVVGAITALPMLRHYSYCDRCGEDKADGRENRSGLCQRCEAESTCKHMGREQGDGPGYDYVCRVGLDIKAMVGDEPGWLTRIPCRYFEGGCSVSCGQFEPIGIEAVKQDDADMEVAMAKTFAALSVVPAIKAEHKGHDWSGVVDCPVCEGRLHVSHSGYNGHVHGRCETDDCVAWME